jgi:molecular chaperone GrpE
VTERPEPTSPGAAREPAEPAEGLRITDRRRVDPQTGAVRQTAPAARPAAEPGPEPERGALEAELDAVGAEVAALTADLQRVHAEYANYRKRVERDRDLVRDTAVAGTLAELLPVLDDIGRAREHGELEGAFRSVGESFEQAVQRLGLERYGDVGDPFDPSLHEALTHEHRPDVTEPVCVAVYQPGYRFAGRVVRPARVGVADPGEE